MPADTTVKLFHSGMTGAPSLSGTAGALIAVLDALLLNGFGAGTLDSLVIASNVATATRAAGHPFEIGSVVEISGATVSGGTINGQHRVLSTTATTYTFETTGISNQTATGTITHKVAAAGWEKPFSGTNLAAYRSPDVTGVRHYLRVDDTGTQNARVVGYETMSDINTGTGPYPTAAQVSGGLFWGKSNAEDSAARSWVMVADQKTFYWLPAFHGSYAGQPYFTAAFGEFASAKSGDDYRSFIHGFTTSGVSNAPASNTQEFEAAAQTSQTGTFGSRSYTQLGSAVNFGRGFPTLFPTATNTPRSGAVGIVGYPPYPNGPDGGLYVSQFTLFETDFSDHYRGRSRGLYAVPQSVGGLAFSNRDRVDNVTGLSNRTIMMVNAGTSACYAFDVTGPWS